MEEKRKGFFDICNLIKKHKEPITLHDVIVEVCEEGWYTDFKRIPFNSVIRQINNHNKKFPKTTELPYKKPDF